MSEFIDELLIVNIVSRLPIESVLQCRCVCKRWRDVLHELHFTQIYTEKAFQQQQQQKNLSLYMNAVNSPKDCFPQIESLQHQEIVSFFMLVNIPNTNNYEFHLQDHYVNYYARKEEHANSKYPTDNVVSRVSRPLEPPQLLIGDIDDEGKGDTVVKWFIIGSIHGLIGLYGYKVTKDSCNDAFRIIVYNPVTREYLDVPTDDESLCVKDGHMLRTGFGYNPKTKEYKIVRIINHTRTFNRRRISESYCQIYTLGSHSKWRITKIGGRYPYHFDNCRGVFFKGAIYWLSYYRIIYLDMDDEKLRELEAPQINYNVPCELRVFSECLCLIQENLNIWIMKNYITIDHSFSFREYTKYSIPRDLVWIGMRHNFKLIALTTNGKILCFYNRYLISYDTKIETHNCLCNIPLFEGSFDIVCYTKSLVSLKALGEEDATEKKRTDTTKRRRRRINMKTQLIKLFTSLLMNLFVD